MVKIRMARAGSKKRPYFHVTVADARSPRDGRFIERVGFYNPGAGDKQVRLQLNQERIDYWVRQGARPSDRVTRLISDWARMMEAAEAEKVQTAEVSATEADAVDAFAEDEPNGEAEKV